MVHVNVLRGGGLHLASTERAVVLVVSEQCQLHVTSWWHVYVDSLVWEEKSYAVWTVSLFFTLLTGISTRTDFRSAAFYVSSFFSPPHMMGLMEHAVLEINFADVLALRKTTLLPGRWYWWLVRDSFGAQPLYVLAQGVCMLSCVSCSECQVLVALRVRS